MNFYSLAVSSRWKISTLSPLPIFLRFLGTFGKLVFFRVRFFFLSFLKFISSKFIKFKYSISSEFFKKKSRFARTFQKSKYHWFSKNFEVKKITLHC